MKRIFTTAIVLASLLMSVSLAVAAPIVPIIEWSYTADGIFTSWTVAPGSQAPVDFATSNPASVSWDYSGGVYSPGSANGYRTLSWGEPVTPGAPKSSLNIDALSGSIVTNGPSESGIVITHQNSPIWSPWSDTLTSGIVRATLELTPTNPNLGFSLPVFSTLLEFAFFETPNTSDTPQDMFVLLNPAVTTETFTFLGYDYTFTFGGFSEITDQGYIDYFKLVYPNYAGKLYGWLTPESQRTILPTSLSIAGQSAVPEPGTALLLGVGLLGLSAAVRRRSGN